MASFAEGLRAQRASFQEKEARRIAQSIKAKTEVAPHSDVAAFEAQVRALENDIKEIKEDAHRADHVVSIGIDPEKTYAPHGRPKVFATQVGRIYEGGTSTHPARSFVAPTVADLNRFVRRGMRGRPRKGERRRPFRPTGGAHGPARDNRLGIRRFRLSDITQKMAEEIAEYGAKRLRYHIERRNLIDTGTLLSSAFGLVDKVKSKLSAAHIGLGKVGKQETRLFESAKIRDFDIRAAKARIRFRGHTIR